VQERLTTFPAAMVKEPKMIYNTKIVRGNLDPAEKSTGATEFRCV
jgi:hypothetical protein